MTTYLNTYAPPKPSYEEDVHLDTPPEAYDLNFQLTAQSIRVLEGEGREVRLEPFIVSPPISSIMVYSFRLVSEWEETCTDRRI